MPELPEVETLCRQVRRIVVGDVIRETRILDPKLVLTDDIVGRRIRSVDRFGKLLTMELEGNLMMGLHLRMTGRLLWQSGTKLLPHTRFLLSLTQGTMLLIDTRRFATLSVQFFADRGCYTPLGIDALDSCDAIKLKDSSGSRRLPVKSFLMNQGCIAGIGNIYACEILHAAMVNPWRRTCDLSVSDWDMIGRVTQSILNRAISCRGTTIADWRDFFGRKGGYQHYLKVYSRERDNCVQCGAVIERRKLHGVGTYFCPECQT